MRGNVGSSEKGSGDSTLPTLPWEGWTSTAANSEPRQAPEGAPELVYFYVPGAKDGSAASELAAHFEREIFSKSRVQRLAEDWKCVKQPVGVGEWGESLAPAPGTTAAPPPEPMPKVVLRDANGETLREFTKKTDWRSVATAMESAAKKAKKSTSVAAKKSASGSR